VAGVVAVAGTAVALAGTAVAGTNGRGTTTIDNYLSSVATIPHTAQAFAVGQVSELSGRTGSSSDLIEHWKNGKWVTMKPPASAQLQSVLTGVWAASAKDVWAVGSSGPDAQVLHWTGAAWSAVGIAGLPANVELAAVSGTSSANVWAVGSAFSGNTIDPLELHFNGSKWSVLHEGGSNISPQSVAATSAKQAFALGSNSRGGSVALRFNGSAWKTIPLPKASSTYFLNALSARGGEAWFVGSEATGTKQVPVPFALLRKGSAWHVMKPPKPKHGTFPVLVSVLDLGNVVWASGTMTTNGGRSIAAFTEKFVNGKWAVGHFPPAHSGTTVSALGGDSIRNLWAVGSFPLGKICASSYSPVSFHFTGAWRKFTMPGGKVAGGALLAAPKVPTC
jgi:hypothetical protein